MRNVIWIAAVVLIGAGGAYGYIALKDDGGGREAVCPHDMAVADCPFCTPDLVESMGHCAEHDVAEALCWICRPDVIVAYRAKGDWCGGHGLPESRCEECRAGRYAPGETHENHEHGEGE